MLNSIMAWIAGWVLKYLADQATQAVKDKLAELALDKERGLTNDANVKKYQDAKTEKDRIDAAISLLNRNAP